MHSKDTYGLCDSYTVQTVSETTCQFAHPCLHAHGTQGPLLFVALPHPLCVGGGGGYGHVLSFIHYLWWQNGRLSAGNPCTLGGRAWLLDPSPDYQAVSS